MNPNSGNHVSDDLAETALVTKCQRRKRGLRDFKTVRFVLFALVATSLNASLGQARADSAVVVVGAAGTDKYGEEFKTWSERWRHACEASGTSCTFIGLESFDAGRTDKELLKTAIESNADDESSLWIVLIGHGTPFGKIAKYNLRGPDVSTDEFAEWLQPLSRRVAIVNCTSASGHFLQALSGEKRVVVTATQSGAEINYARFGDHLSQAISNRDADLDHDDQVSLLEAFLTASKNVQRFYEQDNRLATEHALLDDNGDRQGTPATFFQGIRATKSAKDGAELDGTAAHQMILLKSERESKLTAVQVQNRDRLEAELDLLRRRKASMSVDEYYKRLEAIMIEMAKVYAE